MPLLPVDETDPVVQGARARFQAKPEEKDITFFQQMRAAGEIDNTAMSAIAAVTDFKDARRAGPDPDFDLFDHLTPAESLVADRFIDAESLPHLNSIRDQIKRERSARATIEEGPANPLVASLLATVIDPINLVPLGGAVAGGRAAVRIGRAALLGTAATGAAEAALQATQRTRTITESLVAVAMGGALGASFGGVGAALAGRTARASARENAKAAARDFMTVADDIVGPRQPESAGAAAAPSLRPEDTILAGGQALNRAARAGIKALDKIRYAPVGLRLLLSENSTARKVATDLVDSGLTLEGNLHGHGVIDVETLMKMGEADIARSQRAFRLNHKAYKKRLKDTGEPAMNADQFSEAVARALRRGDRSEIPEVQEMARAFRENVFEPRKRRAIELGLLPEDVDVSTAQSYLTRSYNTGKIAARKSEFISRVQNWLARTTDPDDYEAAELADMAEQLTDKILGTQLGRMPLVGAKVPAKRGPLKERTFNIPDAEIEDFLENDVRRLVGQYVKTMDADLELTARFGDVELTDVLDKLAAEVTAKQQKPGITEAESARLQRELKREQNIIQDMVAQLRGLHRPPADGRFTGLTRIAKVSRDLAFTRLMGGMVLSAVPDIGIQVMRHGLLRTFGGAMRQTFGTGFKGIKMARAEARTAGSAWETEVSTRSGHLYDVNERYSQEWRIERFASTAANVMGNVSLMNPWNEVLQSVTSGNVSTHSLRTIRDLADGKQVDLLDRRLLARRGIDDAMVARIAAERKNWQSLDDDALLFANTDEWTDREAARIYQAHLLREIDNSILAPGVGDAPLWTSTEWGKTIFQFKRFGVAATGRITLAAAQGLAMKDIAVLNGLALMTAMGAMAAMAKDFTARGEVKERTPEEWIIESLDRSGALSVLFEYNNIAEITPVLGEYASVRAITGERANRRAQVNAVGRMFGPSFGQFQDIFSAGAGIEKAITGEGDVTQRDFKRALRLAPFHNVFYYRWLLNRIPEDEILEIPGTDLEIPGLDLPERSRR